MRCQCCTVDYLTRADRFACAALCRPDSDMQSEFTNGTSTQVAVVYIEIFPVAWCASHVWRGLQTLEGYTHESFRRRGIQRFAASGLIATGVIDTRQPVAVFSPSCVGLTRSLGFLDVKLFERSDGNDWIEVPL